MTRLPMSLILFALAMSANGFVVPDLPDTSSNRHDPIHRDPRHRILDRTLGTSPNPGALELLDSPRPVPAPGVPHFPGDPDFDCHEHDVRCTDCLVHKGCVYCADDDPEADYDGTCWNYRDITNSNGACGRNNVISQFKKCNGGGSSSGDHSPPRSPHHSGGDDHSEGGISTATSAVLGVLIPVTFGVVAVIACVMWRNKRRVQREAEATQQEEEPTPEPLEHDGDVSDVASVASGWAYNPDGSAQPLIDRTPLIPPSAPSPAMSGDESGHRGVSLRVWDDESDSGDSVGTFASYEYQAVGDRGAIN